MPNVSKSNNLLADLIATDQSLIRFLKPGDLAEGKVIEKSAKMLAVDLGPYGTGVVYRGELQNAKEAVKNLEVGSLIHAKVEEVDNEHGLIELSLAEAGKQKAWLEIQELQDKDEILKVKITGFNKGGLVADIKGVLAFLPVSQLSAANYPKVDFSNKNLMSEALAKLVGEDLEVKIIDLNPRSNKLIISEKAATEVNLQELAKNYSVGQVIEGIISGVADFGAFVRFTDNPAVEGLIRIADLDHRLIENPKEIVKVDEVVKAKIVDIKDGRIFLSLKALKPDPWANIPSVYKEGAEVSGTVYSFNPFGAIVNFENGLQGQIHVTNFGGVAEMKKALNLGAEYQFIIDSVKPEERRIILKLKK